MSNLSRWIEHRAGVKESAQNSIVNLLIMLLPNKVLPYVAIAAQAGTELDVLGKNKGTKNVN